MRIRSLRLKNFRQFRNVDIELPVLQEKKDLHVFVGVMGTGKSNILNAINWCLYGEEPFLSREDKRLPLLNVQTLREAEHNDKYTISVEIKAEVSERQITFLRNEICLILDSDDSGTPRCQNMGQQFRVMIPDDEGNSKQFEGDEAEEKVDLFVPRGIKEFFFFDGERLDEYFREATGQRIQNAVYQISQVQLLEITKDHLEKVVTDLQKEAGKLSPDIERIRSNYEKAQQDLKNNVADMDQCKQQIKSAKQRIKELEDKLRNVPDTEGLESERSDLKSRCKDLESEIKQLIKSKNEALFYDGIRITLEPAIEYALQVIQQMRQDGDLPPTFDRHLLKKLLSDKKCICDREIAPSSPEELAIRQLIETIRLSPEASQLLMAIEGPLHNAKSSIMSYSEKINLKSSQILRLENDLTKATKRIQEIDRQLAGYNMIQIRRWNEERSKLEEALSTCQERIGELKVRKQKNDALVKELGETLSRELKKESRVAELRNDIAFTENAIQILHRANQDILYEIRSEVERKTQENFFALHWKRQTYEKVIINDDYTISPKHVLGYDTLGTLSGGEREVLALAFSTALHDISGFSSAIVVDRPLAMVSGKTRQFIAEIFSKVADQRQVVLLLTPEDFAEDVSTILHPYASTVTTMRLSSGEGELIMKGK
ncbi:MAG: AAA family ATPase [Candidatus Hodarchaeales archaeon]